MISFLFIFVILLVSVSANSLDKRPIRAFTQVLIHVKDVNNITATVGSVIDPLHLRARTFNGGTNNSGLYTVAEANGLFVTANNYYIQNTGFNFSNGTYNPTQDSYALPGIGIMFPFANGDDYQSRFIFDNLDKNVGKSNTWIVFTVGHVVQFTATGTFLAGPFAGLNYTVGDLLGCHEINFLDTNRTDEWNIPGSSSRRIYFIRSRAPTRQIFNLQGIRDTWIRDDVIDRVGNVGWSTGSVIAERQSDGVTIIQNSRTIITFPRINIHPNPPA